MNGAYTQKTTHTAELKRPKKRTHRMHFGLVICLFVGSVFDSCCGVCGYRARDALIEAFIERYVWYIRLDLRYILECIYALYVRTSVRTTLDYWKIDNFADRWQAKIPWVWIVDVAQTSTLRSSMHHIVPIVSIISKGDPVQRSNGFTSKVLTLNHDKYLM